MPYIIIIFAGDFINKEEQRPNVVLKSYINGKLKRN